MAKTANEALLDASIKHQIDLQRYSNGVVRRMIAILNRSDQRLFAELVGALERMNPEAFTVKRLEAQLASVRNLNAQAYAEVGDALQVELKDFTAYEAAFQAMLLETVLPAQFAVAGVLANDVYAAALARPFQGVILKGALADLEAGKARKIRQAIAQGFVEGKSNSQIVREIRGTRALGYADGLMEVERRHLQTIVQTAVAHTAGFTQDRFYAANADILKGVTWNSKLDGKTSTDCIVRDSLPYTLQHKPIGHSIPWLSGPGRLHWNCRSSSSPVLKSFTELLGLDIDESAFPEGTRASMDGQVPAKTTYKEWLVRQPADRQDDILGPTRGGLLREGKLEIDRFWSEKGEYRTLAQLRELDQAAFSRANL